MPWIRYAAAKVGRALFVIWAAYTLSFVLLYLLPVKAVDLLFDPQELMTISNATKQKVAAEYGFNKPAFVQYGDRLWAALHGNFGTSVQSGAPVWKAIGDVFPPTLVLAAASLVLALAISFTIAFFAANSRHLWLVNFVEALPSATVVQTPSALAPSAALHTLQPPVHAVWQHTPSTQYPVSHCASAVHPPP